MDSGNILHGFYGIPDGAGADKLDDRRRFDKGGEICDQKLHSDTRRLSCGRLDLILASSVLIKNSLGVVVLILLVITIMAPVLKIIVFNLALSFVTAIVEPIAGDRIVGFLSGVGKNLTILLVSILAVAFMLFILIMLIIFSANTFV